MAEQGTGSTCEHFEDPNHLIKLTCLRCGKYAATVGTTDKMYLEVNCKSPGCTLVNCYTIARDGDTCRLLDQRTKPKPVMIQY